MGAVCFRADAFELPRDGGTAEDAEAGVDLEGRRVRARGVGSWEAAAADGAGAAGAQAVGQQGGHAT